MVLNSLLLILVHRKYCFVILKISHFFLITCYMCQVLPRIWLVYHSLLVIMMCFLSFTYIVVLSRTLFRRGFYFKDYLKMDYISLVSGIHQSSSKIVKPLQLCLSLVFSLLVIISRLCPLLQIYVITNRPYMLLLILFMTMMLLICGTNGWVILMCLPLSMFWGLFM